LKITSLLLARYGHVSDVELQFAPDVGLHIVLGANEAGKSTALAAIADALFGFPDRTPYAFLHDRKDLRVGIGLHAADGRGLTFFRRKGRQDTLRDAEGAPLPDSAIAAFLAGASRERFTEMFGMDGAELRRGGAAILEFKGEIGQSLVQAYSRRQNARGALASLNEQALALYGDRRGGRAFHSAAEKFRSAKQDLDERAVRPADYDQAVQRRAACVAARDANAAEMQLLDAERARLDRIRRTTPARLALERYRADLAALGNVRPMPPDAEARRATAIQAREILLRTLEREMEAQAEDTALLRTLHADEAILAQGDTVSDLLADLNRIGSALRDREIQRLEAAGARTRAEEAGRRLGLSGDAEAMLARMPGDLVRAAAQRAIKEHTQLSTRAQEHGAELERASAALEAARALLAAAPAPGPAEALLAAIEWAKAEGPIDAQIAQAEEDHEQSRLGLEAARRDLPFWTGTVQALADCKLPLAAAASQAEVALAAAALEAADRRRDADTLTASLLLVAAEKAGLLAAGQPPTAEAIAAARLRRDRAWRLIRRQLLEGGAPPGPAELDDLPANLADALAQLIADADALADRRAGEAARVAAFEQCLADEARTRRQLETAQAALEEAAARQADAQAAWQALWQQAGVAPGDPASMREWRARRDTVLTCLRDADRKAAALGRLRARRDAAREHLAAVLPDAAPQPGLAPLLRAAERRRQAHEDTQRRHEDAARAVAEAERRLGSIETRRAALAGKTLAWRAAWSPISASLGLPPDTGAEAGADALGIWTELDRHEAAWRTAGNRVEAMTADIEAFAARAKACVAACAPDLAAETMDSAVRALATRLAASRAAAAKRAELDARMGARGVRLKTLEADLAAAEDSLLALRALAGAADDAALQDAIARARAAAALALTIGEREAELRRLDDGLSVAALAAEAGREPPELLPARIEAIDARRRAIAAENEAFAKTLMEVEGKLAAMERGLDAAEASQRMQDAAAEAQEIATRYVRLRLAHTLLRAGLDRFRREQQAPLLAKAGALFAALTGGRYERLATDETEDGRMVVVGLRPDGTHCPAERLSEGTRDQLYLSLRLAAIGMHAAHAESLPFIADDLLASFDDTRARAALRVLADFSKVTQTILFTHHAHIAEMADPARMHVHRLS
jgi:uncharacterized protein YhaN